MHIDAKGNDLLPDASDEELIMKKVVTCSQMKLLDAWMEIHKDDLAANWKLLSNGEQFFRIDPLK